MVEPVTNILFIVSSMSLVFIGLFLYFTKFVYDEFLRKCVRRIILK